MLVIYVASCVTHRIPFLSFFVITPTTSTMHTATTIIMLSYAERREFALHHAIAYKLS